MDTVAVNFIDLTVANVLSLLVIGFIGGLVSGFIGSGGAFVLTPAMMTMGVPGVIAVASNMCHKCPKALVGAYKRNRYGHIDIKLGLVMHFNQNVEPQIVGGGVERLGFGIIERRHDDENAICAIRARFIDLIRIEQKILAQRRQFCRFACGL